MTKTVQTALSLFVSLVSLAGMTRAQAIPTAQRDVYFPGFQLPAIGGSLSYAVSVSEAVTTGYYSGGNTAASTNFSGDVAYLSGGERHPFSMVYTGGYLLGSANYQSVYYQSLMLSQVLKLERWNFIVADSISYLPETPTIGLSGIPGVGDLGADPVQTGNGLGPGILTVNGARISNNLSGSAVRSLTASTSLSLTGSQGIQRFLDSTASGYDSTQESGSVGLQHRLDARSSVGGSYSYGRSSYSGSQFSFASQSAQVEYSRQLSQRLSFSASVGPEWTAGNNALLEPTMVNLAATLGLAYRGQRTSSSLTYSRGTNTGYGVLEGARSDSISYGVSRNFARVWNTSGTVGYSHATSIFNAPLPSFSSSSEVAGVQVSRGIFRALSAFGSYTLAHQSIGGSALSTIAYSGLYQVVSVGLTYSPAAIHLRR